MKIKLIILSYLCFMSVSSFSSNRCFDESTNTYIYDDERISNCWIIDKKYDYIRTYWYPTCKNSFATSIDPKIFGHVSYLHNWCPNGIDTSVFSGLNYQWNRNNECDLFKPISRTASTFWLLKKLQQYSRNYGGHHFDDWHSRTTRLINESGGLHSKCDFDELEETGRSLLKAPAFHNDEGVSILQSFFFSSGISSGAMNLVHEAQHEHEGHITCTRSQRGDQCDYGFEMYNIDEDLNLNDNAYTISNWFYEDVLRTHQIDDDNFPERYLERVEEFDENGNWQVMCNFKLLLSYDKRFWAAYYISRDQTTFNIPKDVSQYAGMETEDFTDDMNPKWVCSPRDFCNELDFTFNLGDREDRACNELLNPSNVQVNERNRSLCTTGLASYIDALTDPENQGPEGSRRVHQRESNRIIANLEQCSPITQEQLNQYCDDRINAAPNAFEVDEHGYLEKYGQNFADLCVQRFCSMPRQQGVFDYLERDSFAQIWNRHKLGENDDETNANFINNNSILNMGRCPEYFCGDDFECLRRYLIYGGNLELARAESGGCTDEYLQCIDQSIETFNLEEYPEYITPEEYALFPGEDSNEVRSVRRVTSYPCYEEYRSCKLRSTVGIARILAQMYLLKKENEILVRKVSQIDSKVNPSDFLMSRLRKPTKELFTRELMFQMNMLEKNPRSFETSQNFYNWFMMPENISKFFHYNPQAFLMFFPKEHTKYYAGDWIDSFTPFIKENILKENGELISLFEELEKDKEIHELYSANKIRAILLKASKVLSEKQYKQLVQKLYRSKTVDEQLENIKSIEQQIK